MRGLLIIISITLRSQNYLNAESLLPELRAAGALDWSRAVIDGSCSRCRTPASRQSRSRRQQVTPDPKRSGLWEPELAATRRGCEAEACAGRGPGR